MVAALVFSFFRAFQVQKIDDDLANKALSFSRLSCNGSKNNLIKEVLGVKKNLDIPVHTPLQVAAAM